MNANQKKLLLDSDDDKKEADIKDLKVPFDMSSFWRSLGNKYFKPIDELNVHEIRHLAYYYSRYGNTSTLYRC
jgi:hypothetical protein